MKKTFETFFKIRGSFKSFWLIKNCFNGISFLKMEKL